MNLRSFRIMKGVSFMILLLVFSLTLSASLLDVYKSGKIKLVPDPDFGKGTEWDIYFPQGVGDIAFLPDGSFFATGMGNKAQHCVYKFDKNGKFLKKIGRKGRGPGDLYHPGALSILDNKYLLVADYPLNMKISVFDLNGKFIKIIKTRDPVFDVVGLGNNKIAILTFRFEKAGAIEYSTIYFEDIKTEKKSVIKIYKNLRKKLKSQGGVIMIPIFTKQVYLYKFNDKSILCGFSGIPRIDIFSFNGNLIKSFKLKVYKEKPENNEKKSFYKYLADIYKKNPYAIKILKRMYKNNTLFPEDKPYYSSLYLDNEGNVLVFGNIKYLYNEKKKELYIANKVKIDIWTKELKYVGKMVIDPESREGEILSKEKLWFNNGYIYYFDDEGGILKRVEIEKNQ